MHVPAFCTVFCILYVRCLNSEPVDLDELLQCVGVVKHR